MKIVRWTEADWSTRLGVAPVSGDLVKVAVLIDAHGIPLRATPVSGRSAFYPMAIRAALDWRFQVEADDSDLAPFLLYISFVYRPGGRGLPSVDRDNGVETPL